MDAGKLRSHLLHADIRATIFFAPALDEHQHLIADIRTQQQIATLPCLLDQLILELALLSLALFACELVLWNRGSCSHLFAPDLAVERFPRTIAEPESQCTLPHPNTQTRHRDQQIPPLPTRLYRSRTRCVNALNAPHNPAAGRGHPVLHLW